MTRDVARAIKKRLAKDDGFDPIRARGQRRDNRRNVQTVGDLCAEWLRARASGKKSLAGDTSKINRYIKPALGRIPVVALGRDDVAALHRQIAAGDPDANPPIPPHLADAPLQAGFDKVAALIADATGAE